MTADIELDTTFLPIRRRARKLAALLLGGFVLCALGPAIGSLSAGALWVLPALAGAAAFFAAAGVAVSLTKRVPGRVRIDGRGVQLGDDLVPRAAIEAAYVVPDTPGTPLHVELRGKRDARIGQIDVASADEGRRIVERLGLSPREAVATFRTIAPVASLASRSILALLLVGAAMFVAGVRLDLAVLVGLSLATMLIPPLVLTASKVDVGADGLRVRTRMDERFVPWSDVESIEYYARGMGVRLRGETLHIPVTARFSVHLGHEREARAALVARATEALELFRSGGGAAGASAASLLERRGRTFEDWQAAIAVRSGGFRIAPVEDERLWEVVESPGAAPTARAAAAALLVRKDPAAQPRLRIAADACAEPTLARVLEAAASGAEQAAIEEALAEVEDPGSPGTAPPETAELRTAASEPRPPSP